MDQLEEWITYIFDHPVTDPEWYWSEDAPRWQGPSEDVPALIADTFEHGSELLRGFTDEQLDQGFWFLVGNTPPDFMLALVDPQIPPAARLRALRSFVPLFEQVMAIRCSSHFGLNEDGGNPLNSACVMWWDLLRFPLLDLPGPAESERALIQSEILSIQRRLLAIPHDACRQSALHGLGHWARYYPEVSEIIDEFLSSTPGLHPELIACAQDARIGNVL